MLLWMMDFNLTQSHPSCVSLMTSRMVFKQFSVLAVRWPREDRTSPCKVTLQRFDKREVALSSLTEDGTGLLKEDMVT